MQLRERARNKNFLLRNGLACFSVISNVNNKMVVKTFGSQLTVFVKSKDSLRRHLAWGLCQWAELCLPCKLAHQDTQEPTTPHIWPSITLKPSLRIWLTWHQARLPGAKLVRREQTHVNLYSRDGHTGTSLPWAIFFVVVGVCWRQRSYQIIILVLLLPRQPGWPVALLSNLVLGTAPVSWKRMPSRFPRTVL